MRFHGSHLERLGRTRDLPPAGGHRQNQPRFTDGSTHVFSSWSKDAPELRSVDKDSFRHIGRLRSPGYPPPTATAPGGLGGDSWRPFGLPALGQCGGMLLKRLASRLPFAVRQTLRIWKYSLQAASGRFHSDEPEFQQLPGLVRAGDWVLDVGANVGQYTVRFSELVGRDGRVIAFEPIVETAEILAAMARRAPYRNVTLFNIAVTDHAGLLRVHVPLGAAHLPNYFQARVSGEGDRTIPCFALDELPFPHRIALVKIDVEEHEVSVIRGMSNLIERDHPILIIEGHEGIYPEFLAGRGYRMRPKNAGSCNMVFLPPDGS